MTLDLAGMHWKTTELEAADISFEEATTMIAWLKITEEYTWKKNALRKFIGLIRDLVDLDFTKIYL